MKVTGHMVPPTTAHDASGIAAAILAKAEAADRETKA
jgi:hypothetical protein